MRVYAFQLTVLMMVLLTAGTGCSQAISASESESVQETESTAQPSESSSYALNTEESAPPTTQPEAAPSALELATATPPVVATNRALNGVIRQLRAGVEETVLLTYINSSTAPFDVGSEEIIYLTDLGAPGHVINAMIERDQQLQSGPPVSEDMDRSGEAWPPAGAVAQVPVTTSAVETGAAPPAPEGEAVAVEPPVQEVSVDYFYGYLAPYGTWVDIPEYGLCWQPSVGLTTTGWRPYGDRGRWVYSDYGWYWYSDYTWGWATFHYGRWLHNSRWGWCWAPGTVWGPSWVSWRYSDPYCGWAPLPPYTGSGFYFSVGISWGIPSWCYTYVPSYRVCSYYPCNYAIPYARARQFHGRAKAYDRYSVGRDNAIYNRGIPPERLARDSGVEIRHAQIKERQELPAGTSRRERLGNDGETLTVYQPRVAPRQETGRMQTGARNEPPSASRDRLGDSGSTRILGGRYANPTARNQPQSPTASVEGSRSRPARQERPQSAAAPHSLDQPTARGTIRSEPTARDRTSGRAVTTQSSSRPATSTVGHGREPGREERKPANSSLVIIGNRDSRLSKTSPNASQSAGSRSITSPQRPNANASQFSSKSRMPEPSVRTEPASTTRSIGNSNPSITRVEPTRSVTRVPATPTRSAGVTRTTPTISTRSAPQSAIRSQTIPRTTLPSRARTQPTPRTSYTAPVQRSAPPAASLRTYSSPSQPTRSAPSVRTAPPAQRSAPSYSRPSVPSRPSAPPARSSAPPGRSGERSSARSR